DGQFCRGGGADAVQLAPLPFQHAEFAREGCTRQLRQPRILDIAAEELELQQLGKFCGRTDRLAAVRARPELEHDPPEGKRAHDESSPVGPVSPSCLPNRRRVSANARSRASTRWLMLPSG